jgi:hypothetical protein
LSVLIGASPCVRCFAWRREFLGRRHGLLSATRVTRRGGTHATEG